MRAQRLEIIPINHQYSDSEKSPSIHFSRIRQLNLEEDSIDDIYYILFDKEEDEKAIQLLQGSLRLIYEKNPKKFFVSLRYPEIIRNIKRLRQVLEENYEDWVIYLNLTPLRYHLHAILLRDGLNSTKYELMTYEIFDYHYRTFNYAIIPEYKNLDLVDFQILELFFDSENTPLNLRVFVDSLESPDWNKKIKTYDQKVRNRLNYLVDKGLLSYEVRQNGEKFYRLKYFKLEYSQVDKIG